MQAINNMAKAVNPKVTTNDLLPMLSEYKPLK